MSSTNIPWPDKDDVLFSSGDDWWHNACLNWARDDWTLYILGYRKAAKMLVENVQANPSGQDFIIYPAVFLYRQYLELRLKRLIYDAKDLLGEPSTNILHHHLDKLWHECSLLLNRVSPEEGKEEMKAVDEIIQQFCEIDPNSMAFRYPTDKKDVKSIPNTLKYINFRNLSEVMEKIANFLDAAAEAVLVDLDYKRDMESAFNNFD